MKTTTIKTAVKKETEKAIMIEGYGYSSYGTERTWNWWLPKSKVTINENGITIPNWLLSSKLQESGTARISFDDRTYDKIDFFA